MTLSPLRYKKHLSPSRVEAVNTLAERISCERSTLTVITTAWRPSHISGRFKTHVFKQVFAILTIYMETRLYWRQNRCEQVWNT